MPGEKNEDQTWFFDHRATTWRADLVRVWYSAGPDAAKWLARGMDFVFGNPQTNKVNEFEEQGIDLEVPSLPTTNLILHNKTTEPRGLQSLWLPTKYLIESSHRDEDLHELEIVRPQLAWHSRPKPLSSIGLASWPEARTTLRTILQPRRRSPRIDIDRLVEIISRGVLQHPLPTQTHYRFERSVCGVEDSSARLIPYQEDHRWLIDLLRFHLPRGYFSQLICTDPRIKVDPNRSIDEAKKGLKNQEPTPGCQILVLGDLGILDPSSRFQGYWYDWIAEQARRDCRVSVMVPFPVDRVPSGFRDIAEFYSWQHSGVQSVLDREKRAQLVAEILSRLSPVSSFDPVLLRWIRQTVSGANDAALESFVWQDKSLDSNQYSWAKNDRVEAKQEYRKAFLDLDSKTKQWVLKLLRRSRAGLGEDPSLWFVELLSLDPKDVELIEDGQSDMEDVRRAIRYLDENRGDAALGGSITSFLKWFSSRVEADGVWSQDRAIGEVVRRWQREFHPDQKLHTGTNAREVGLDGQRQLWFKSDVDGISVQNAFSTPNRASNFVRFDAQGRILEVHIPKNLLDIVREQEFWDSGEKPSWVSEYGSDQYGAWCELEVPRHDGRGLVTQRFRWILPGSFMMGSPDTESGRFGDEMQHAVKISDGYWIADTPVTQEFWMAIQNTNESRVKGEKNPVERVSWEDCCEWIDKLKARWIDLDAALPTEAQWEYACRAGSTDAYCFGNEGESLSQYAWYEPNTNETVMPVKRLMCNRWGLFDIHGNVWEWCYDRKDEYTLMEYVDPRGPDRGPRRVIRGGSWSNKAHELRAACRSACHPGDRNSDIGFRLVISSINSSPSLHATEPVSFWKSGSKPTWVKEFGTDEFGLWFEFRVPHRNGNDSVIQRMRWIEPGSFFIGSPLGEEGRNDDESHRSETIRKGFWISETPVTQELWEAINGNNPSANKGEKNPVEKVSFADCATWVSQLDQQLATLGWRIPKEEEWEYACRAGTQSAYSFGNNAAELSKYAWHKENADNKTHPVKKLHPNNWGLWDCHGNVFEWCIKSKNQLEKYKDMEVARGGSFKASNFETRSAHIKVVNNGAGSNDVGFRIIYRGIDGEPNEAVIPDRFTPSQDSTEQRPRDVDEFQITNSVDLNHLSFDGLREQSLYGSSFLVLKENRIASTRLLDARCHGYQFDNKLRPSWAADFGMDEYGVFAVFEVFRETIDNRSKFQNLTRPICQKMRWIPPGPFQMGYPGNDKNLMNKERRHPVLLTRGYWMFDTPCTQALWVLLMDENPSCFLDYERPVENITWKDTQNFCRRLNQLHSTADFFRLPTEAEWERACRAGTQNTIYDGDIENDKPETRIALGRVAWYAENSGDAYDLEKSIDRIVRNAQNQPCLEKQGTRKVGKKIPNEWGLYDMLGNVWEWCSDAFGYFSYQRDGADTQAERLEYVMDPTGPKGARTRVIRGGAWNEPAHNVRAACRDDEHPNTRDVNIGFRLVGSSGAPPYEEDTNSEFRK